mmetsp:Transcript_21359/g.68890  ORF Transcript_21359/g.68890 Transcript_21359/m.68890 type:complete len:294 (-) Transcript_21359:1227-2108(-)
MDTAAKLRPSSSEWSASSCSTVAAPGRRGRGTDPRSRLGRALSAGWRRESGSAGAWLHSGALRKRPDRFADAFQSGASSDGLGAPLPPTLAKLSMAAGVMSDAAGRLTSPAPSRRASASAASGVRDADGARSASATARRSLGPSSACPLAIERGGGGGGGGSGGASAIDAAPSRGGDAAASAAPAGRASALHGFSFSHMAGGEAAAVAAAGFSAAGGSGRGERDGGGGGQRSQESAQVEFMNPGLVAHWSSSAHDQQLPWRSAQPEALAAAGSKGGRSSGGHRSASWPGQCVR